MSDVSDTVYHAEQSHMDYKICFCRNYVLTNLIEEKLKWKWATIDQARIQAYAFTHVLVQKKLICKTFKYAIKS